MTAATPAVRRNTMGGRRTTALPTLGSAVEWLMLAIRVSNERRNLAGLSDERLADLGLSAHDVQRETRRGFWDLPLSRHS
ncbi:DUF1127 domain-containing protein [Aestuariibius sp. 2305UL40-4]|uniref:DUF1127 domain-containing protein n=1 Tax=Aestuariibius violaceus TaxID=3234132 RepID=UPI00345ECE1B